MPGLTKHVAPFQGADDRRIAFRWPATTGYYLAALRAADERAGLS